MKKILFFLVIIVVFYLLYYKNYNISDDSIRFRVISNSNNMSDIIIKEKVVEELSDILFIENESKKDASINIFKNLNNIEKRIDKLFRENNYNKQFNISFGKNIFPKKYYHGKIYKSGEYDSLVIEIGEAKGDNFFCILYPSLCVIDYNEKNDEKEKFDFKFIKVIKDLI